MMLAHVGHKVSALLYCLAFLQFIAVLEEPLQAHLPLMNTSSGQLVLAVINNDGTQTTDSIVSSLQLGQGGANLGNFSPVFSNAIMGMLQQSMAQQQQPGASSSTASGNTSNLSQLPAPTQGMTYLRVRWSSKNNKFFINNAKFLNQLHHIHIIRIQTSKNTWASFQCFLVVFSFSLQKHVVFSLNKEKARRSICKRRHFENKFIGGKSSPF
jgi:hypothetical protein